MPTMGTVMHDMIQALRRQTPAPKAAKRSSTPKEKMAKLPAKTRRRRQSAVANAPRLGPYEWAIVWLLVAAACLPGVAAVLAAPEAASIVAGVTAVAATFRAIILGRFRPFASARALAGLVVAAKRRLVGQPFIHRC